VLNENSEYTVIKHRPWKWRVLIPCFVLLGGLIFYIGHLDGVQQQSVYKEEQHRLLEEIQLLNDQNAALMSSNALLDRGAKIEHDVYVSIKGTLSELQDEAVELKEQLSFYQNIVSPSKTNKGLRIQSFKVSPRDAEGNYRYRIIATKSEKTQRSVSGIIDIKFRGKILDKEQTLNLKDLIQNKGVIPEFRFRYFQSLEGDFNLPGGFEPHEVVVTLKTKGRTKSASVTLSWAESVSGGTLK